MSLLNVVQLTNVHCAHLPAGEDLVALLTAAAQSTQAPILARSTIKQHLTTTGTVT